MPGRLIRTNSSIEDSKNYRRGHAPSSPEHTWRTSRNRFLTLLLSSVLAGAMQLPAHAGAETKLITTPAHARMQGLESLRRAVQQDGGVPLPANLDAFIKNREAAVQLGKALFWDMQVGSDGVQACASCHFHAGADNRSKNQINPGLLTVVDSRQDDVNGYFKAPLANANFRFEIRQPNETLKRKDFPFVKSIQDINRAGDGTVGPGANNSNDIAGSMGMLFTLFNHVRPGFPVDAGTAQLDPVWNIDGQTNVRRVEPRNTPTVINAVFNFTNFWEGRANPHFNGVNEFGEQDPTAAVVINRPGEGLAFEIIALDNASLASQALAPPPSAFEMSFAGRSFPEIGLKLLRPSPRSGVPLTPLGLQQVHPQDSVLGPLSNASRRGLSTSYEAMIKAAFTEQYWNSTETIDTPNIVFTQMEFNFGLFFGLAVAMYEATLVADQSPFDQWMETGHFNSGFGAAELAGLNLFVHQGQCISCHAGPELTAASVRNAQGGKNLIRATHLVSGTALHDNGFYNVAVTPTTDDLGRGGADLFGQPLAFARQALFARSDTGQNTVPINFPIIGNDHIPAQDGDSAVCTDTNANGVCDPSETILLQRVAVDGAFKTPGLRNVELTGPYFHNGGMATLRQVVQFFNRGGNFCSFNNRDLDQRIKPLGLSRIQEKLLVEFLVSLTDRRVKYQKAPFDHPELRIPEHGLATATSGTRTIEAVGAYGSYHPLRPFLDLDPQDPIYTPKGTCMPDQPAVAEVD
jgi:cytochrome c peroxidase